MRENDPGKTGFPERPSIPPSVQDDRELDEIMELLGDADLTSDEESASLSDSNFVFDDILKEYEGDPSPVSEKPSPTPAPVDEPTQRIVKPVLPAEPAPAEPAPTAAPAQSVPASAVPVESPAAPHTDEEEAPDVRQTISDQVSQVMDQKKSQPHRLPKHVAKNSAVQVADEYEEVPPKPDETTASSPAPTGPACSDDLRSFRGLTPADALAKAKSAVRYYRWRSFVTLLLSLLSAYVTAAPTYGLPLPSFVSYVKLPFVYLFILNAIQIGAMFLCVSLLADGLRMLFRRKFKAETLLFFPCLINLLYTMQIMVSPTSGGYLPYHPVVILSLFFGMLTRLLRYENVVRTCRALTLGSGKYAAVNGIHTADGHVRTVYKQEPAGLERRVMDRLWDEDRVERFLSYYSPFALVLTAVFAAIAALSGSGTVSFLWCWSALLSVSLPGGLLVACVMPSSSVSGRLAHTGTILAGPRAPVLLNDTESVILQERDVFPTKMISFSPVRVFSGFTPEKVDLCTLAVLKASGSGLYHALAVSLSRVPMNMPLMENFEFYETGGMGAFVNSDRILVGTANFILRSGVRIPEGINLKNGVFVSINMQFAGLYPVKYDVQPSVRRALTYLTRRHLTPILAVRDFSITPQLVEAKFKIPPDSLGFPDLGERIAYSGMRDGLDDEPIAALAVDSAVNFSDAVASGKRVFAATRVNLVIGLIAAILGVGLNFFLLFTRSAASITPINVLYYTCLWFVPALLVSFAANRR
ncbi:MAG: hypothetical protein VB111_05370 [Clostridiaceae bacterium]|nr:hypothetical protein [Clostridiaceae bacterium]